MLLGLLTKLLKDTYKNTDIVCIFGFYLISLSLRLEVQADVQKERYSLSGESGTVSLGTVSDNASTKAMAGSILNSYIPLDK